MSVRAWVGPAPASRNRNNRSAVTPACQAFCTNATVSRKRPCVNYARMNPLRLARFLQGLSQEAAAEKIGVGQQHYSRLERGLTPTTPERLSEILAAITMQEPADPEQELIADIARPLPELRLEADGINDLLTAIVKELRAGGDRALLAELAGLALSRQRRILGAIQTRIASLKGRAN